MTPEYKTVPILDAARRAGVRIADGQAGRYEVKAFCPFCLGRTKNPHLYLNTEKNRFFCQRCGEHGNSVSLYAKIRGISNKEAFEELEKSNLQMFPQAAPKEPRQEYMAPLEQRHDVYYDLLALLSLSEHDFLDLLGRGLTLDAIEQNMYRSMPARVETRSELAQTLSRTHDLHLSIVWWFLNEKKLPADDWFDVVILRYLLTVKRWFTLPELRRYSFTTLVVSAMKSAVNTERRKQNRRPQTISLDAPYKGTYGDPLVECLAG